MGWLRHKDLVKCLGPRAGDSPDIAIVRQAGLYLADSILAHTVPCADQSAAVRKVREAVMLSAECNAPAGKAE